MEERGKNGGTGKRKGFFVPNLSLRSDVEFLVVRKEIGFVVKVDNSYMFKTFIILRCFISMNTIIQNCKSIPGESARIILIVCNENREEHNMLKRLTALPTYPPVPIFLLAYLYLPSCLTMAK